MSFRVTAIAALAVLGVGPLTPAFAQPQAPIKPRYTQFQTVFNPYRFPAANPGQGLMGANLPNAGNPSGPQAPGYVYVYPGLNGNAVVQQQATIPSTVDTSLPPTGVVGTFNNLGPWYNKSSGHYGNWYPNGVANGRGVLGTGTNSGGQFYAPGMLPGTLPRPTASPLGAALLGAATVNQFRR